MQSSQHSPCKTVWGGQSAAPGEAADTARSVGNLHRKTRYKWKNTDFRRDWTNKIKKNQTTEAEYYSLQYLPTDCELSTTGTRETGVSWQKSCKVRSEVAGEVKPFNKSCCIPENPVQCSWPCSFSRRSRFSALSNGTWEIRVYLKHFFISSRALQ